MIEIRHDHRLNHMIGMLMLRQGFRFPREGAEVLVEKATSTRAQRRQRGADSRSTGRKSRRNAFRQRRASHEFEQNLLGIARVYLDGVGTDAMRRNVTRHVHQIAADRAAEVVGDNATREELEDATAKALKEIEGRLLTALVASRPKQAAEPRRGAGDFVDQLRRRVS